MIGYDDLPWDGLGFYGFPTPRVFDAFQNENLLDGNYDQ